MYLDLDRLFSDDQGSITTAGTYIGTNALDLITTPPHQIGNGNVVCVRCQVTADLTSGTDIQFQLIEDDAAALTSPTVLTTTPVITVASGVLVAGYTIDLNVPIERLLLQYLGVQYVTTGTFDGGTITAGIWIDQQTSKTGWASHSGYS
jgi:hypothetical protein